MWGSREVAVSAENAGTSSNLSNQGTNVLSVNGYASSSLTAIMVTGTSFSGGTSKKAKIVSKADIDKLKKDLTDSLKLRAKDEITTKFSDNYLLLTTDPEFKIISEKPSVAIGGEAASVDYEIVAQATLKGISKTNLTAASKLLAEKKVSELGEIDIKNSTSNYELKGYVNGTATILLTVNAKYYIKLKETELKEKIAGKNMSDAKNALSEVNNLVVDELTIYPTFIPDFLKKVPTGKDKVTFIVTKK
jgi:LysM repeat protein